MGWRRWVGGGRSGRKWAEVGAPNFLLRWHDTEVAIRTSTCKWLKHNCSRPVLPLHWVKKGIFWKIATSARLPPDCRPIAATPNLFLFWHDTEVAMGTMGTSTYIWLKDNSLYSFPPLHWVKKGIWWEIPLNTTSSRLDPIAALLPPRLLSPTFFFFDTIQRLQCVLAVVYDSNVTAYVHFYLFIESRKEFGAKYHFRPLPPNWP